MLDREIWQLTGFLDARAKIYIPEVKPISIAMGSGNRAVIEWVADTTQSTFSARLGRNGMRKPCIEHCPIAHQHWTANTQYRWNISGAAAAIVLYSIAEHLFVLHDAGTRALKVELVNRTNWHKPTIAKMEKAGWDIP